MSYPVKLKKHTYKGRSLLLVLLVISLWSFVLACGLGSAMEPPKIGTVDPVPRSQKLAQELYLENCGTCHMAVPPAVLPTETWRDLLQDPEHYRKKIQLPIDPPRLLVWNYLQLFSRPQVPGEVTPYRMDESRYFKALHPKVALPNPVTLNSCVTCHTGAADYNFRTLTPEWETSP